MKSSAVGKATSRAEITSISSHGVWLFAGGKEYFLDYETFPWFRRATVEQISTAKLEHGQYLSWPLLDVDLELASLESPEQYPLRYR
jgi:hypothetical protein